LKQGTVKQIARFCESAAAADAYRYYSIGLETNRGSPPRALLFQKAVNADPSYFEAIIECAEINMTIFHGILSRRLYRGGEKTLQDSYRRSLPVCDGNGPQGADCFSNMSQKDAAKLMLRFSWHTCM
jgi:hypothetical protein